MEDAWSERSSGLDLDSRRLLQEVLSSYGPTDDMSLDEMRRAARNLAKMVQGEPPHIARIFDQPIESDGHEVMLRVYDPMASESPPILVWLHGGGFVTGGLDAHDTLCRQLAAASGCIVVAVDYRLAPEHPFPAAVRDSYAAALWASANAEELGARPKALAVGGSSAGGNLAAATCLLARDEGAPVVDYQVLVYPVADAVEQRASYFTHATGYQLTADMMRSYLSAYAPEGIDQTCPYLSPIRAATHEGLPPAHVVAAEFDPLYDEVLAYADHLAQADVPVIRSKYSGVMHGFFGQAGALSKARDAQAEVCRELRRHFFMA